MKNDPRGKQPIFSYDAPKNIAKGPSIMTPTTTINIGGGISSAISNTHGSAGSGAVSGGRSAAISSMIKKTEIDLMSLEKNPFGNYRANLQNNVSKEPGGNINESNILSKVEDLVVKKISEYKDILAAEFKKNLSSVVVTEEEKKDLKFLKENFKTQQTTTDQIISHINQFAQALNEINTLMASHSEILGKVNNPNTNLSPDKQKSSIDDISYKQLDGKIKFLETQLTETRSMMKQLNESILGDIKENFKKSLKKLEQDQDTLKNNLKENHKEFEKIKSNFGAELNDTKTLAENNQKKNDEFSRDFNLFCSQIRSEIIAITQKKGGNEKEQIVDQKWAEKILKVEADLDLMIKKNQHLEKKLDDFILFKHTPQINDLNEKYENLRNQFEQRPFSTDSPQKRNSGPEVSPLQKEVAIDDNRFNSLLQKTKENIEKALSNSPLKYEQLERNVYLSPANPKNESPIQNPMAFSPSIKREEENIEDWYLKYKKENLISYQTEFDQNKSKDDDTKDTLSNKYSYNISQIKPNEQLLGIPASKSDLSMRKMSNSEGRDFPENADPNPKLVEEEKDLDRSRQPKQSLDDYGVAYLKNEKDNSTKQLIKEFEEIKLTFASSQEEPKKEANQRKLSDKILDINEGSPQNDEIVYHLDDDGFLMDEEGSYIVDDNGQMIKLSEDHIDYLRKSNMIEDDKLKEKLI